MSGDSNRLEAIIATSWTPTSPALALSREQTREMFIGAYGGEGPDADAAFEHWWATREILGPPDAEGKRPSTLVIDSPEADQIEWWLRFGPVPVTPNVIWEGKSGGAGDGHRIVIVGRDADGRIRMERIAGCVEHAMNRPVRVTEEALRHVFRPTGERREPDQALVDRVEDLAEEGGLF